MYSQHTYDVPCYITQIHTTINMILTTHFPLLRPYSTAFVIRCLYCSMLAADSMSDGFVVASVGLYCFMAMQIRNHYYHILPTAHKVQGTSDKLSALQTQYISVIIQQAMHLNKPKSDLKVGEVMLHDFAENIQYVLQGQEQGLY